MPFAERNLVKSGLRGCVISGDSPSYERICDGGFLRTDTMS